MNEQSKHTALLTPAEYVIVNKESAVTWWPCFPRGGGLTMYFRTGEHPVRQAAHNIAQFAVGDVVDTPRGFMEVKRLGLSFFEDEQIHFNTSTWWYVSYQIIDWHHADSPPQDENIASYYASEFNLLDWDNTPTQQPDFYWSYINHHLSNYMRIPDMRGLGDDSHD